MAVTPLPFVEDLPYATPLTQAVYFVVAFLAVYAAGRLLLMPVVRRGLKRRGVEQHARRPLIRLTHGVVLFVAIGVAFGAAQLGSFLSSLSTIAAAGTLAIGFASKDLLANLVSGVFIYVDQPFKIGDWIEWDDYEGEVEDISLRVTRVRTFDNELLTVPNSQLADGVIKNPVEGDRLRMKFVFGIGYDDDIDRATEIILEAADDEDDIMDDPEPSVRVVELGDSSVGLQSRFWIEDPSRSDYAGVRSRYVKDVKERFDAEGVDIPYPNRTLGGEIRVSDIDGVSDVAGDATEGGEGGPDGTSGGGDA